MEIRKKVLYFFKNNEIHKKYGLKYGCNIDIKHMSSLECAKKEIKNYTPTSIKKQ